jgi:hypothetical protein
MDGSIKLQAEPAAEAKQKPCWLIRAGRGRTGGICRLCAAVDLSHMDQCTVGAFCFGFRRR